MRHHRFALCDTTLFRPAFVRSVSRCETLLRTPPYARRQGQPCDERRGTTTDELLTRHLAGKTVLATPAAVDGCAHLPPHVDADDRAFDRTSAVIYTEVCRSFCERVVGCFPELPLPAPRSQESRGKVVYNEPSDTIHPPSLLALQLRASFSMSCTMEGRGDLDAHRCRNGKEAWRC